MKYLVFIWRLIFRIKNPLGGYPDWCFKRRKVTKIYRWRNGVSEKALRKDKNSPQTIDEEKLKRRKFKTNSREISKISRNRKILISDDLRPMHLQIQNEKFWRIFLSFAILAPPPTLFFECQENLHFLQLSSNLYGKMDQTKFPHFGP